MSGRPLTSGTAPAKRPRDYTEHNGETNEESAKPESKRRRTALACAPCRSRKIRCDGRRPNCSSCQEMGFECEYHQLTTSTNVIVGKDYLSTLEGRLKTVEAALEDVQNQLHEFRNGDIPTLQASSSSNGQVAVNAVVVQDLDDQSEQVDAMGAVVFQNEEDSGFFGPSSNIAFLRRISQAAVDASNIALHSPRENSGSEEKFIDGGFFSFSRPGSIHSGSPSKQQKKADLYVIPPEAQVVDLLHRFFSYAGYFYPYVHEDNFLEIYNKIKNSPRPAVRRSWLGLFNMILAMAVSTKIDDEVDAADRFRESDIYYQRAYGLCGKLILRGTSLEIVQYLLLMGQYLQGTQKSIEAWVVHGLAVKAAMQLGLHSSEASSGLSCLEREIRKRTWFGCVIHDRALSMTFGRPSTIPESYVKLSMPDERGFYATPSSSSSWEAQNPLNVHFYVSTIQVYRVLWNIIDQLYGQNIGCDGPLEASEIVTRLFGLEQQLIYWEQTLHPNLRLISSDQLEMTSHQPREAFNQNADQTLRTVLTLRFLNIRLLLHRPVLVKFLDSRSISNRDIQDIQMLRQIGVHSVQVCMSSASQIISIVHAVVTATGATRTSVGAWWYTLYFTFNAALVIFGCFFICRSENAVDDTFVAVTVEESVILLNRAINAMEHLDKGNHMVDRCRHYLQLLVNVTRIIDNSESGNLSQQLMSIPDSNFVFDSNDILGLEESSFGMDIGDLLGFNFNL